MGFLKEALIVRRGIRKSSARLRPQTLSVFAARRSGKRPARSAPPYRGRLEGYVVVGRMRIKMRQLEWARDDDNDALAMARLALRRCRYLIRELERSLGSRPEASALLARAIIETSLVGSYLALRGDDSADRLLKRQAGPARRLRERFLNGELTAGLSLLPDLEFVSAPLAPDLSDTSKGPDLASISAWLDHQPPFQAHRLATLLYDEAYVVLSGFSAHPTPQTLARYEQSLGWLAPFARKDKPLLPSSTYVHACYPAVGALAGSIARAGGEAHRLFDTWAAEAATVDGYHWTSSPARHIAVSQLARVWGLNPPMFNIAGFLLRAVGMTDTAKALTPEDQILLACDVFVRAQRPSTLLATFLGRPRLRRPARTAGGLGPEPPLSGANDPRVLVAALGLVYASIWPDDPQLVGGMLDALDEQVLISSPSERPLDRVVQTPTSLPSAEAFLSQLERFQ